MKQEINPYEGFQSREDLIEERKSRDVQVKVTSEQKTYVWTRVYLNSEDTTLEVGDEITIEYIPSGEKLTTTFGSYNKKNLVRDKDGEIIQNYDPEDDKTVLCLAVDIDFINKVDNNIPFIRTLFKQGRFYDYQLMKYSELKISSSGVIFDYKSIDF